MPYIFESANWPNFTCNQENLLELLAKTRHRQGRLVGRMEALGFPMREEAMLRSLTEEVLKSSEIEGEHLDREQVRSSLARKLGMVIGGLKAPDRHVDGVVEMMLDATQNYLEPLNTKRLFGWHAALFPSGHNGISKIRVGKWRDDAKGLMQVVSGHVGREKVHFEAPSAVQLPKEMRAFLSWINAKKIVADPVIRAAIAHLWFVTIHPFEDGNGRIARAISDMMLARSDGSALRFYSMSAQISAERKGYYDILEYTQRSTLDITEWLEWFLSCLGRSFERAELVLASVLRKATFWDSHLGESFNERQQKMINRLFDGFEGKLTSSKWATLAKCSQDTASRDIEDLVNRGVLVKNPGGGRSTSYSLKS